MMSCHRGNSRDRTTAWHARAIAKFDAVPDRISSIQARERAADAPVSRSSHRFRLAFAAAANRADVLATGGDSAGEMAFRRRLCIRPSRSAVYRMRHPVVGRLTVTQQLLTAPQAPGQTLVICSAPKHSPSAAALQLLARTIEHGDAGPG